MRYVGGLSVHASYFERALSEARSLARALAETAQTDAQEGRKPLSDRERFRHYIPTPWSILEAYLDNLSDGTFEWEHSLIAQAARDGTFTHPESTALLEKAAQGFRAALSAYQSGDYEQASDHLAQCSTFWTHATWKEFLESDVIGTTPPKAYRPLEQEKG